MNLTLKRMCCVLTAACLATGVTACGMPKKEAQPVETTAAVAETTVAAGNTVAAVEDALHNITRDEMVQKTGIDLPAPEGAEDVSYHVLMASSDKPIAQMEFTLEGHKAYLRAQATDFVPAQPGIDAKPEELAALMDTKNYDISGMYYKWDAMGTADVNGRSGMYCINKDTGFIAWLDVVPGILYNLCMKKGANQEILQNLADTVFVPLQGDAG